jgi:SulP family sulfate permease
VLERYAETLARHDGQLFLANVSEPVRAQLERTGALDTIGANRVLPPEEGLIGGLSSALASAEAWLDAAEH